MTVRFARQASAWDHMLASPQHSPTAVTDNEFVERHRGQVPFANTCHEVLRRHRDIDSHDDAQVTVQDGR
ncbi:hypothetical protein GCM10010170_058460 [Dactylosporangium salmoneum]|uniref:Uncharacterized protein n=1 Tax=Dactylosporangium salmoneum TaxID=53361 RepID=A0ABP5TWI5_9ACTN